MSDHALLIVIVVLLLVILKGGWVPFLKDLWEMAIGLAALAYIVVFFGLFYLLCTTKPVDRFVAKSFWIMAAPIVIYGWVANYRDWAAKRAAPPPPPKPPRVSGRPVVVFFLAWVLSISVVAFVITAFAYAPTDFRWEIAGCVALVAGVCAAIGGLAAAAQKAIQWMFAGKEAA
jgi:hypothetical protein